MNMKENHSAQEQTYARAQESYGAKEERKKEALSAAVEDKSVGANSDSAFAACKNVGEGDCSSERTEKRSAGKEQLIQMLKFTGFSISAGVIQLVSDGILCDWTGWLPWWPAYLISVLLSVIWNFTFNRKFTFRAANNVPVAMGLVVLYYCAFIPLSVFGGDAIAARLPANFGLLVTFMMMLVNFVTEFIWDKFVVFNDKVTQKIVRMFEKKKEGTRQKDWEFEQGVPDKENAEHGENKDS